VGGRLDLFALGPFEQAWQSLPPPRRFVVQFDERHWVGVSPAGVEALAKLCAGTEEDTRAVVLLEWSTGKPTAEEVGAWTAAGVSVFRKHAEAVAALGDLPAEGSYRLPVKVRATRASS
jgi:hypothetical protein